MHDQEAQTIHSSAAIDPPGGSSPDSMALSVLESAYMIDPINVTAWSLKDWLG
jgi:hypothetical protein